MVKQFSMRMEKSLTGGKRMREVEKEKD